jgi:hypothetical protein
MLSTAIRYISENLVNVKKTRQRAKFYLRELYEKRQEFPLRILTGSKAEIVRGLWELENYYKKSLTISECTKMLRERGLYIGLAREEGKEFDVLSSDIKSVVYALRSTDFLHRINEIEYFLSKIISAYEKEEQDIPVGRLDLFAALKQFNDAVKGHDKQKRAQLENTLAIQAVKDHLELESNLAIAKKYRALINLLNETASGSFFDAAMAMVNTAQELWPGGNPCIMMYREEYGRQVLVPIAVALPSTVIAVGEKAANIKLGRYSIPVTPDSWNPYVDFFREGGMRIEKDITRDRHRKVCEGFINRRFSGGILEDLFWGISYPGPENALLTTPLKVMDPVTRKDKTIALFAVLRKGYFSKDDMQVVQAFVRSIATTLAQIQWQEELRGAVREARAYAREKEGMQKMLVESERLAAMGKMAAITSHGIKQMLMGIAALNEELMLLVNQVQAALYIIMSKAKLGVPIDNDLKVLTRFAGEMKAQTASSQNVLCDSEEFVRGMLSFARVGSGRKQIVPVKEYIKTQLKPYENQAKREGIGFYVIDRELKEDDGIDSFKCV